MKKTVAVVAIVLFTLALVAANYFIISAHSIDSDALSQKASDFLGRKCSVGYAAFSDIAKGKVDISNLSVESSVATDGSMLFEAERVVITADGSPLIMGYSPKTISVLRPVLHLRRDSAGAWEISDVFSRFGHGKGGGDEGLAPPSLEMIGSKALTYPAGSKEGRVLFSDADLRFFPLGGGRYYAEGVGKFLGKIKGSVRGELDPGARSLSVDAHFPSVKYGDLGALVSSTGLDELVLACGLEGVADVDMNASSDAQGRFFVLMSARSDSLSSKPCELSVSGLNLEVAMNPEVHIGSGRMGMSKLSFLGRNAQSVSSAVEVQARSLTFSGIMGSFCGGTFTGDLKADAETKEHVEEFEFYGASMSELCGLKTQDPGGKVYGKISSSGDFSDIGSFKGAGTISFKDVNLWQMPVFGDIKFALGLVGSGVFENGQAVVKIRDRKFEIESLNLTGSDGGEVTARGTIGFNGELDLTVNLNISKSLFGDITPLIFSDLWSAVERSLYAVEVKGTLDKPVISIEALPFDGKK